MDMEFISGILGFSTVDISPEYPSIKELNPNALNP